MAEEIKIPFRCTPHRVTNPNCVWDHLTLTNNHFMVSGWRMRDTEIARVNLYLPAIPSGLHGTPNAKLRVRWVTASASGSAWKLFVRLSDVLVGTDTYDPTTFDLETDATDTSPGAGRSNDFDFTITGPNLSAGRELIGYLERNAGDVADVLAADIVIPEVLFIADAA